MVAAKKTLATNTKAIAVPRLNARLRSSIPNNTVLPHMPATKVVFPKTFNTR
jgi:hypothetical protein